MAHKSYGFGELRETAKKHSNITVVETKTGVMLFTEYGARLLGLFPNGKLPNVLWTHHDLDSAMAQLLWGVGGERLWLSPEQNYFYDNPRDFENHRTPPGMDPGTYEMTGNLIFENEFTVFDFMRNEAIDDCYARRIFAAAADPYGTGLDFAGVKIQDTMILGAPDHAMCPWSLAMLYTCGTDRPGTAFFPIKAGGSFLGYFGPIPAARAQVKQGCVRFKIDAAEVHKLALRPEDIVFDNPCKALYVSPYPQGDQWFCVIKRSDDLPRSQKECVDPAKADPHGERGATQSYNSGPSTDMAFGEIELQLTKGKTEGGRTASTAEHELLAYAGSKGAIMELAKTALRIEAPPECF